MFLEKFPSGPLETNAILFGSEGVAAAIDPSPGSAPKLLKAAEKNGLRIEKILLTHSHWDHFADAHLLKEATDAPLFVHPLDAKNVENPGSDKLPLFIPVLGVVPDHFLYEGEKIAVGKLELEVIHTPGHSPGSVCFYLAGERLLFAGDTLFRGCMGRIDLPTGSGSSMWKSLKKLARLPLDTKVVSGHGPDTTIGNENWMEKAEELFS